VDASEVRWGRRRWWRRERGRSAPPSLRGTLFLASSTFLCGAVLAGLLFVGIWRHTASEQVQTEAARQHDRQQLLVAQHTVAKLRAQLTQEETALTRARRRAAQDAAATARARALGTDLRQSMSRTLQELIQTEGTLASQSARIESELQALEGYTSHPGATGLDAGYLGAQIDYLLRSAAAASSTAADLLRSSRSAAATFG
jgi:hypothetical protein